MPLSFVDPLHPWQALPDYLSGAKAWQYTETPGKGDQRLRCRYGPEFPEVLCSGLQPPPQPEKERKTRPRQREKNKASVASELPASVPALIQHAGKPLLLRQRRTALRAEHLGLSA
ncbi:hypothetical protein NDU88_006602 [Pleurodeles waltl]|uniref:Uncharacterized protein n=1 Tax=Pleurodeles waltl TaxID=8319 RepID=A0AAV7X213_PLEWA|nr:hypothetical protein NDU88_006602 [Pleurodeles waltl]